MAITQAVLLIADIGGYTKFMTVHRINLAHAQEVVARLLESIIGAAGDFKLAKLEGDAAFFYAPLPGWPADVTKLSRQVADIRIAFLAEKQDMAINQLCSCDGCVKVPDLKLKFVAHVGEVAEQKVAGLRELAGVSVITVHRMLKNSVPVPEYLLMTEPLFNALHEDIRKFGRISREELEGIGDAELRYVDLTEVADAQPPVLVPSKWRALRNWLRLTLRSLPYMLGLKKPCEGFRNMQEALGEGSQPPQLPEKASSPTGGAQAS
ncbi:MAG: DUF2652 domain-containing protein [Deltaproteobacteria bacterium]|nr:DUF2652 domain-containing protein [Deltaproteobacteria bacterium]